MMTKQFETQLLPLGALLHDIGKFRMRAEKNPTEKDHSQWGAEWLELFEKQGLPHGVSAFALWHHRKKYGDEIKNSNLTLIVEQADNYAAESEREEKEEYALWGNERVPITSILSTIHLNGFQPPTRMFYPIEENGNQILFPLESSETLAGKEKYTLLWKKFEKEFENWCKHGCHLSSLLLLLDRYTAFIPSETLWIPEDPDTYPDISLFDHLKTTCAISLCLYEVLRERYPDRFEKEILLNEVRNKEEEYFRLIGGDLSGVQKFIYTVSSKGALKILRAKSFFIELFMEHVTSQILKSSGLTRANVIYIGGGRFYILAPNTQKTMNTIQQIHQMANDYLWEEFGGKLALMLESIAFRGLDFQKNTIAQLWKELSERLGEAKNKKYEDHIYDLLEPKEPVLPEGICSACYRDDASIEIEEETEESLCTFCKRFLFIGSHLPKTEFVITMEDKPDENSPYLPIFGTRKQKPLYLIFSKNPLITEDPVYQLRPQAQIHYEIPQLISLSAGEYVRYENDIHPKMNSHQGATFEMLSEQAKGKEAIAALRMDVDRLGEIFRSGIPENRRTFTRMAVLSRQLTLFFKNYLPLILKGSVPSHFELTDISGKDPRQNGRNLHVIYSGGDDLFLIGAWDDVAESAIDIHRAFSRFSGGNPSLTLSGGFVVQKPDYPLYHLAELAHEAEQAAKESGRNRLTLFYSRELEKSKSRLPKGKKQVVSQTVKWDEVERYVLEPIKNLIPLITPPRHEQEKERRLSHGDLQKFLQITERWEREGVLYLPHLAYMLARIKDFKNENPSLCAQLMEPGYLPKIRNALVWLDLLVREKTNMEE